MLSTSRCELVEAVVWCSDEVQQLQLRFQLQLQLLLCDVISMWTCGVSCVMLRCSGEVQQAVAASNSSQLPTNSITNVIKYQLATVPANILECNNYTHTNDAKLTKDHCGHHFIQFVMTILTLILGRVGGKMSFLAGQVHNLTHLLNDQFLTLGLGTSSARNENLRPLLNTNITLISGKYGLRNHFWPLECRFLMRKSEKNRFSQTPLNSRFWALGFLFFTLSCANVKKIQSDTFFCLTLYSCH